MAQSTKRLRPFPGMRLRFPDPRGRAARFLRSQFSVYGALCAGAGFLLSQAMLPGGALPFSVPLVAALCLLRGPAPAALVGCALGVLLRWQPIGWENGWPLAAGLLLFAALRPRWRLKPWLAALAAAGAMLLPLPFWLGRMDAVIRGLSGAVAAGLLVPAFHRALLCASSPRVSLGLDDQLCCLLLFCSVTLGGQWLRLDMLSLGGALLGLGVYALAWAAGSAPAMSAGALGGLAWLGAGGGLGYAVALALLGAVVGLLRRAPRFASFSGGVLACGAALYAQGGLDALLALLPSLAAGGALFLLLPGPWLDALGGLFAADAPVLPGAGAAAYLLDAQARALDAMARALPDPAYNEETAPAERLAWQLCPDCPRQRHCWDARHADSTALLDSLLRAIAADADAPTIAAAAREQGCLRAGEVYPLAAGVLASREADAHGDARRAETAAWALSQLRGQARALLSLRAQLTDDTAEIAPLRAAICAAMPALRARPDALTVCMLGGRLHIWLSARGGRGHIARLQATLSQAVGIPLEVIHEDDGNPSDQLLFVQIPRLRLHIGRAACPIDGEALCGDSTLCGRLDAGRYLMAISDGMGSGLSANAESRAALTLLLRALQAGYARADALRAVNALLLACRGEETYATLDLCLLDLNSGEAVLDKQSACPSYLLSGGRCQRIGGDALPMGILSDAVRPGGLAVRLEPGDLLLMVSDGVLDAFGGEDAPLLSALSALHPARDSATPQEIAQALLQRALERTEGRAADDMTVLVGVTEEAG
ncbi:MAG: SpoIIE family protein phosphatase [Oscillospiraceae bacterium]|jgi:stage II sporulation protein E|nr:SpoIIE family protein phosphatase [Oscillospiraceae bacterium]